MLSGHFSYKSHLLCKRMMLLVFCHRQRLVENIVFHLYCCPKLTHHAARRAWGRGAPFPPCPFTSRSFALFYFFFAGFNYCLLLSIPFLSTKIVPLRFQAGVVVFILCYLCYLYSLVKMDFDVLLYLV